MYSVQVTDAALQQQTLNLENGKTLQLELYYRPMQFGWFINEMIYGDNEFILRGMRITVSQNMLYQWKNLLPFGLACFSQNNREPSQQEDFSSGSANLYILTTAEVLLYSEFLSNGPA